jgi:hypothetical protein
LAARRFLVNVALITLGFLVAVMPILIYYYTQPEALFSRFNQVGIFQSGWLLQAAQDTGESEAVLILRQFKKAFLSIFHYADRSFHYYPERPFLGFIASIFFVLGTVFSLIKSRDKPYFWMLGSLLLILTFGAALLENPSQSQRLVMLAPVLAVLVSIGIVRFSGFLESSSRLGKRIARGISFACVAWIAGSSVWFYFVEYTPRRTYGNPTAYIATEMARFIKKQDSVNEVVFIGAPFMYGDFGTLRFLLRNIPIIDIIDPIQGDNPEIRADDQSIYIFHPARRDEFDLIQELWGAGEQGQVLSDTDEVLFFWYRPI